MFNWKFLLFYLLAVMICTAQNMELLSRPIRPQKFTSHEELQDYLQQLKTYHLQNGLSRYGKRFSPPQSYQPPAEFIKPNYWKNIYEIVKAYDDN